MSGSVLLTGVCGGLIVCGLLLGVSAMSNAEVPAGPPWRRRLRRSRKGPLGRRTRVVAAVAAVIAGVVWLASGWPVGGAIAGLTVVGLPWLLRQFSSGNDAVGRLEAL